MHGAARILKQVNENLLWEQPSKAFFSNKSFLKGKIYVKVKLGPIN